MRTLLGALVITTGAFAVVPALAQESDCVAPSDGTRFEFEDPTGSTIRLEWRASRDGAKLRIQLSDDGEFGRLLIDREMCCEAKLRSLDVGRYHWRVMDVDAEAEQCRASFEIVAIPKPE